MSDRYDSLSPRDLIVTLRSLPRRYGSVQAAATRTQVLAALIDAPNADGLSLSSLINDAERTMTVLGGAINTIVTTNDPVISAKALTHEDRVAFDGTSTTVKRSVGLLGDKAVALADQLDTVSANDWSRTAAVTGGGTIALIDLVRDLVRSEIETLRAAESQVEWMKLQ